MEPTVYRGYQITPIFNYTNGRTDGYFWKLSEGEESIQSFFGSTLEEIKKQINNLFAAPYYALMSKYRFYTVNDFGGSLDELRNFANFWKIEVFEDLPY
jgi:hypothetical protein